MKLSISTCISELQAGRRFDAEEGLRILADAGFRNIDFNFSRAAENGGPLAQSDWRDWAKHIRETADALGLTVTQTHAYWFYIPDENSPDVAVNLEYLRRSVEASAIVADSPWVVTHPLSLADEGGYAPERTKSFLLSLYRDLGETAARCGVQLAIENLFTGGMRYFGCLPEDLLWLLGKLNDPMFGLCWDFGHANRMQLNPAEAFRQVAPFVRVTHVHDNKGKADDHTFPYFGSIPWAEVLPAVRESGYRGNWNFEIHVPNSATPRALRVQALQTLRALGEDMVTQIEA